MKDFCVVGSGIAGSTIASLLAKKYSVEIFDKARGPGGRSSNRRYKKDLSFDFFSKVLELDVVNIDDYQMKEISTDNLFNFDEIAYAKYTNLFLKSNYSDVNNLWPDVAEKISSNSTPY